MTCIVGLLDKGIIYIGGDNAATNPNDMVQRNRGDDKVFKRSGVGLRGDMIFGFTSSYRMGQLLKYKLEIPKHKDSISVDKYINVDFIDAVRETFINEGFATKVDNADFGGEFIFGYMGHLFEIDADFQVICNKDGFTSVGCGYQFALATMYNNSYLKDPIKRINNALVTAEYFSSGVRGPFTTLHV
jgi:hypothetical protein